MFDDLAGLPPRPRRGGALVRLGRALKNEVTGRGRPEDRLSGVIFLPRGPAALPAPEEFGDDRPRRLPRLRTRRPAAGREGPKTLPDAGVSEVKPERVKEVKQERPIRARTIWGRARRVGKADRAEEAKESPWVAPPPQLPRSARKGSNARRERNENGKNEQKEGGERRSRRSENPAAPRRVVTTPAAPARVPSVSTPAAPSLPSTRSSARPAHVPAVSTPAAPPPMPSNRTSSVDFNPTHIPMFTPLPSPSTVQPPMPVPEPARVRVPLPRTYTSTSSPPASLTSLDALDGARARMGCATLAAARYAVVDVESESDEDFESESETEEGFFLNATAKVRDCKAPPSPPPVTGSSITSDAPASLPIVREWPVRDPPVRERRTQIPRARLCAAMAVAARNRARYPPRAPPITHPLAISGVPALPSTRFPPPPPASVFSGRSSHPPRAHAGVPAASAVPHTPHVPPPAPAWPSGPASVLSARSGGSDLSRVLDGAGRRGPLADHLPRSPLAERPSLRAGLARAKRVESNYDDDFVAFQTRPSRAPVRRMMQSVSARKLGGSDSEDEDEFDDDEGGRRMGGGFFPRSSRTLGAYL